MSLRLIRKLGKIVRGGGSTRDVALGVWLGFALGMVPGLNLTMGLLIFMVVILNCNIGAMVLMLVLGSAVSAALVEPLYRMGSWMIYEGGLRPLITELGDTPVLVFLDWSNYCVLSGLAVGLAGGALLAVVFSGTIMLIRGAVVKKKDKSEKVKRAAQNPISRVFMWVFFGGSKGTLAESMAKKSALFRKSGLIMVGILVLLVFLGGWAVANFNLAPYAAEMAGKANGAEVNIANLGVSLHGGSVWVDGVQVTKNSDARRNRFQTPHVGVTMSVSKLLAKQIVVDKIECSNLQIDQKRDGEPGEIFDEKVKFPDMNDLPPDLGQGDKSKAEEIFDYIKQALEIKKYVDAIIEYATAEPEKELTEEEKRQLQEERGKIDGFRSLSASEILRKHPQWLVREIVADIYLVEKFPPMRVMITNLSSDAKLAGVMPTFKVIPEETALEAYLLKKTGQRGLGKITVAILDGLDPNASDGEVVRKIAKVLTKSILDDPSLITDKIFGKHKPGEAVSEKDKKKEDIVNTALGGLKSVFGDKDKEKE